MDHLRISLFGCMRVNNASEQEIRLTHGSQVLLAYLLLYRHRAHPREVLANLLWGEFEQDRARKSLNTTVWRLRTAMNDSVHEPDDAYIVSTSLGELEFNPQSHYWLDVQAFEQPVQHILSKALPIVTTEEITSLDQCAQLYQGDLLEGFYQEWVLQERERLRCLYLACLYYLMQYYHCQGESEKGLVYGLKILHLEPLREEVHREVMRLYLAGGQRALAIRQYELCCQVLASELGILPMPETQSLYLQIKDFSSLHSPSVQIPPASPENLSLALHQLHLVMQSFDRAHKDLERAAQVVENLALHQEHRG